MTVGIVGLGLIGGSFAKAFKRSPDVTVLADNRNKSILEFAKLSGAVDAELTMDNIARCELLLIATYPESAKEYLSKAAPHILPHTVVMDCLGTKRSICETAFPLAEKYGFTFVGGHPMAGTQHSGFKYARAELFDGAPMVIVPHKYDDIELFEHIKTLLKPVGFGSITVTTAQKHDEMIAFTSQMAHIVSNAYIKSPTAGGHKGFSAGSYKDLTRVARLNAPMWTELFLDDADNLSREIGILIDNLQEYKDAIDARDAERLEQLLADGDRIKREIEGR
jgi:prephenate dehydrogenase